MAHGHWVELWAEATRGLAAYRRAQFAEVVAWADRCPARGPGSWNRELPAHVLRDMALAGPGRLRRPPRWESRSEVEEGAPLTSDHQGPPF
jgi:hypothetical protein